MGTWPRCESMWSADYSGDSEHVCSYSVQLSDGNQVLSTIESEKDLGVLVDDDPLKFDVHISEIIRNSNRTLGILNKVLDILA